MKFISVMALIVMFCSSIESINARVLGSLLTDKKIEIGLTIKWFDRDLRNNLGVPGREGKWRDAAFYGKFHINNFLTLTAEGSFGSVGKGPDNPTSDYRSYGLGFGVTAKIVKLNDFQFNVTLQYFESVDNDRSILRYDKNARSTVALVEIQREYKLLNQKVIFLIAPGFIYNRYFQYPPGGSYKETSIHNFGFAVGANFLLFEKVDPFIHFVYANHFQTRIGIGYQF